MFLNIAYITKVNVASLNGGEGSGGNVTVMKKISNANGDEFAYVSGQALRHYLKETLMQLGELISGIDDNGQPIVILDNKKIDFGKFDVNNIEDNVKKTIFSYTDLDLFAYMLPVKGGQAYRRWSPIKVSPLVSLLPYKGEYDYLTRKASKISENKIVQVEIDTLNFMRGNIMVNLSHIGNEINEYTYEVKLVLSDEEKKQRLNVFLDAIKFFNGGAKQARNLEDIAPKFVIVAKQKTGNPFLLNALSVDADGNIDIETIQEALKDNKPESYTIGITKGIFTNEAEIRSSFDNVVSVAQALEEYKNNLGA